MSKYSCLYVNFMIIWQQVDNEPPGEVPELCFQNTHGYIRGHVQAPRLYNFFHAQLSWAWNLFFLLILNTDNFLKLLSCSTQLSMLSWVEHEKGFNYWYFYFYGSSEISCSAELSMKKSFITSGPGGRMINASNFRSRGHGFEISLKGGIHLMTVRHFIAHDLS